MKKGKLTSHVRVERLVSSLTITSLIEKFDLRLPAVQLRGIIRCLVVGTNDTTAGQGCDFDEIHKHFPEEMWGYVYILNNHYYVFKFFCLLI